MSVPGSSHRNQPWFWQVTALCFVLGLLLAASLQTSRAISRAGVGGRPRVGVPPSGPPIDPNAAKNLQNEIDRKNLRITDLETALGTGTKGLKTLNDELQKMKVLAGLTAVHGPGITLTLVDSKKRPVSIRTAEITNGMIHDVDLQAVINELVQSSAEAIAVNSERVIGGRTSIRCVGPTILVNSVPLVPPYVISAIGDPDTLWGGLNLPYGVLEAIRRFDPAMFKLEKKKDIRVPAYDGSTEVKHAKPVQESESHDREGN